MQTMTVPGVPVFVRTLIACSVLAAAGGVHAQQQPAAPVEAQSPAVSAQPQDPPQAPPPGAAPTAEGQAAPADQAQAPAQDPAEAKAQAVFDAASAASVLGPKDVPLRDQATLHLPAGFRYIPPAESANLLRLMGNNPGSNLMGLVFPAEEKEGSEWFVVIEYEDSGHIKDDDAKEWNADDLLKGLKEGTEAQNEERRKMGVPEMVVLGWVEPPRYDEATHRLVWSASTKGKAEPGDQPAGINYNTYALGREGYVSLNLVTAYGNIAADKPIAHQLLAALEFNEGRRYADFNSSTDRLAEYGLAALVGGVAAKKLGLLAVAAAFLAKFAKVIGIAAIAALGIGAKLFKGRKKSGGDSA
jgi:uncharacterized membrane-anchored protein